MAEDSSGSGFFGFVNVLYGLPVVPKIIMFVGLLALISGFFSGQFELFHNPRISAGVALMSGSLAWRDWERSRLQNSSPPYEGHWNFSRLFWAVVFSMVALWMFRICYLSANGIGVSIPL